MEKVVNWVLLRGLARESRHWGDFAEKFSQQMKVDRARILTLDLPGFGENQGGEGSLAVADLAEDLRAQWITKKGRLDGNWGCLSMSLGAMCAFEWVRLFPED